MRFRVNLQLGRPKRAVVVDPAPRRGVDLPCECSRVDPLRWCNRQDRICAAEAFAASSLMAGLKPNKNFRVFIRTCRTRNPYPRNVNEVCSAEPRLRASLQYTMRVLSGAAAIRRTRPVDPRSPPEPDGPRPRAAVDHHVIAVAFELDSRELPAIQASNA